MIWKAVGGAGKVEGLERTAGPGLNGVLGAQNS